MGRLLSELGSTALTGPVRAGEAKLPDLVRALRSVPVAPEVVPKLQAKLQDLDTDSSDLARLIRLDAGLASNVLRVANSAFYARSVSVTDLTDAVIMIGFQETLRVVTRCSFANIIRNALEHYAIPGDTLWRDAVLCALSMEALCQASGTDSAAGYTAGLLHRVGMVAINDYLVRRGHPVSPPPVRTGIELAAWELDTIGFHHAQVGAAMMRGWQFPAMVVSAVERQLEPGQSIQEPLVNLLLPLAVNMAGRIARRTSGESDESLVYDYGQMSHAGLNELTLGEIQTEVEAHWRRARDFLA